MPTTNGKMPDFDFAQLKAALIMAGRKSFKEILARHSVETFYCVGLFTSGSYAYLLPTAMTEEGLDTAAREYQKKSPYAKESFERVRTLLRWSPCDSPLHLEGKEYFKEVDASMDQFSAALNRIDTGYGWVVFDSFRNSLETAICNVLGDLDREGLFGRGIDRERIFLTVLMGDQDDSILRIGRRLNPHATMKRIKKEWDEWGKLWRQT